MKNKNTPTKSILQIVFAGNVEGLSGWNNQLPKVESWVFNFHILV